VTVIFKHEAEVGGAIVQRGKRPGMGIVGGMSWIRCNDVWQFACADKFHKLKCFLTLFLDEKPDVAYSDIGGMDIQKQEVREAVELPLTHFELYKQIGIDPPRGVLMYGPPGCGKTMLAKAVAHHTTGRVLYIVHIYVCRIPLGQISHCSFNTDCDTGTNNLLKLPN
jgi:ATPase family associated with various cellular activities (AAA)